MFDESGPTPMMLLGIAVAVTAIAGAVSRLRRRRRQHRLGALAREWRMQYSRWDIFGLGARVAPHLPVPGAADVHVTDLIYGSEPGGHRYIFSAHLTAGVVHAKHRRCLIVSVLEPRGRSEATVWTSLQVAEPELPLLEQYQSLKSATTDEPISADAIASA